MGAIAKALGARHLERDIEARESAARPGMLDVGLLLPCTVYALTIACFSRCRPRRAVGLALEGSYVSTTAIFVFRTFKPAS